MMGIPLISGIYCPYPLHYILFFFSFKMVLMSYIPTFYQIWYFFFFDWIDSLFLFYILGIKVARKILQTDAMKELGVEIINELHPICSQYTFDTDDYWGCLVRYYTFVMYHPASTCKMGALNDSSSVVDPQLR